MKPPTPAPAAPPGPAPAPAGKLADLSASLVTAGLIAVLVAAPFALCHALLGVQLLAPNGLLLLLVGVPILLLHVLRTTLPRRAVGSVLFWRAVALEQRAAHPFQRLRRSLPLLLQLLALGAIAWAAGRPVIEGLLGQEGLARVIVLDTSASMLAREKGGATRFDGARDAALELIQGLSRGDQATLIAVDRTAWIVVPWTSDKAALVAGVEELAPRHVGTSLEAGLLLAAAPGGPERKEVWLLSDGAGPDLVPVELPGPLRFRCFGETDQDLGLVAVDLRPSARAAGAGEGLAYEVFASVRNGGKRDESAFLGLVQGGRLVAARQVTVTAGSDAAVVLEARLSPGPLGVRLLPLQAPPLDALAVDDEAYLLVPEEGGVGVGLVADESPALERALLAAGARLRRFAPVAGQAGAIDDPELRLVVFDGCAPERLPPRDTLLLAPPRDVGPVRLGEPVERPRVGGWDRSDPLLAWVDMGEVEIERTRPLLLGAGARALVQGEDPRTGQPVVLVAAWEEGGLRRVVVGFDPYRSTWPLRASFPILIRNCVQAAAREERLLQGGLAAGLPLQFPVPPDVAEVVVTGPDGKEQRVAARDGQATFARTDLVGIYTVRAGERVDRFAVNLGAPEETRIAPRRTLSLGGKELAAEPGRVARQVELTRWVALAALLAVAIEAWIAHRRW